MSFQDKADKFLKRLVDGTKGKEEHGGSYTAESFKRDREFKPHPDESASSDPFKPRSAPTTGDASKPKT